MNSFSIPSLGSMIYAMAGMENQLHLIGEEVGVYRGYSANYSGFGFSGMKFKTHVVENTNFDQWVNTVKLAKRELSPELYNTLSVKTKDHPVEHYSSINPLTFNYIVEKYTGPQSASANSGYSNPFKIIKADSAHKAGGQH
jgi:cytochrome o ubiquinol oxidase subunit 2